MFDRPTLGIMPSAAVTRVHLFRHGEVEHGPLRMCRGQADVPLSAEGLRQTAAAAAWFGARHRADRVLSSDLSRCTALAEAVDRNFRSALDLREQDMGEWEGRTWEDLTVADGPAVTAYWTDYANARPTGGESYAEACTRVAKWWGRQRFGEETVVIVTHIGVLRALLGHWLGLPPDQGLRWAPGYASHTSVLVAESGVVIERFGEIVTG